MRPADHSVAAQNPLTSGQALTRQDASYLNLAQEKDCTIWPFEDLTTVTASEAELCVTVRANHVEDGMATGANSPPQMKDYLYVTNGENHEQRVVSLTRQNNQKIAKCVIHQKEQNIWTTEYHGCVANAGALVAGSTSLKFAKLSWSFANEVADQQASVAK
ncbi:MAG: hypothetical protein KBG15_03040 [Kofleriaceae bacterium]|nr:hypothetical protein [Kofleriaceae bacterium]